MRVTQALALMRRDMGRPMKLIKSARLPYDTLVVMAESTSYIPEMNSDMREIRLSVFIAGHRSTSVIIDTDITKRRQHD